MIVAAPRPPGRIYAIADLERLGPARVADAVAEMAEAGVTTIQLRAKRACDRELERAATDCLERLEGSAIRFWIDDRVDLAALLPFAGVHLGQSDLAPADARALLPERCAIGQSTHGREQFARAAADPAVDWVALGPIFPTRSKESPDPVVGVELLAELREETAKPIVAIGGIDETNLARVLAAGADAVALISAVSGPGIFARCSRLVAAAQARA